jgi:hypothetical protein
LAEKPIRSNTSRNEVVGSNPTRAYVHASLITLHVERASLIGNATGGAVSLQFALVPPERVDKKRIFAWLREFGRSMQPSRKCSYLGRNAPLTTSSLKKPPTSPCAA